MARKLWALLLILLPLVLQFSVVGSRGIDPDELEHLHAAFSVSRGQVPYRDFFEHHGPGLYYLFQPLFWWLGPHLTVLWSGRACMACLSCAILWTTWRLARQLAGETVAGISVGLLAWSSVFVLKGIEFRPDVPACLCLIVMFDQAVRRIESRRLGVWLGIGSFGGLAMLFTQKSIVPIAAFFASLAIVRGIMSKDKSGRDKAAFLVVPILGIGLGGASIWGATALAFAGMGAFAEFLDGTLFQLLRWRIRSERWEQLRPMVAADITIWCAAMLQIFAGMVAAWRQHRSAIMVIPIGIVAGCVASLFWVKAVYPQFVLLFLPMMCIAAACLLESVLRVLTSSVSFARLSLAGLILLLAPLEMWLAFRGLEGNGPTAIPHLRAIFQNAGIPIFVALVLPTGLTVWGLARISSRREGWLTVIPFVALGMHYALLRDMDGWLWSNQPTVARIHRVNSLVSPDETVLDGFSGYGALRPHAYYFWWINSYSFALLPADGETKLLKILKTNPPKVILNDGELERMPRVNEWIKTHYEPTSLSPIWVQERPVPDDTPFDQIKP